jgi:hypothetical protein
MEIITGIVSAAIAALVSLVVAIISFVMNKNSLKSEREKFERELQRNMTTRLYDIRLEVYPEAISITDGLRNSRMSAQGDGLSAEYFQGILSGLDQWHANKAFLLLSPKAVSTFYALRRTLRAKPAANGKYSKAQIEDIWHAKGRFRNALRSDIQLLYTEESEALRDD